MCFVNSYFHMKYAIRTPPTDEIREDLCTRVHVNLADPLRKTVEGRLAADVVHEDESVR